MAVAFTSCATSSSDSVDVLFDVHGMAKLITWVTVSISRPRAANICCDQQVGTGPSREALHDLVSRSCWLISPLSAVRPHIRADAGCRPVPSSLSPHAFTRKQHLLDQAFPCPGLEPGLPIFFAGLHVVIALRVVSRVRRFVSMETRAGSFRKRLVRSITRGAMVAEKTRIWALHRQLGQDGFRLPQGSQARAFRRLPSTAQTLDRLARDSVPRRKVVEDASRVPTTMCAPARSARNWTVQRLSAVDRHNAQACVLAKVGAGRLQPGWPARALAQVRWPVLRGC